MTSVNSPACLLARNHFHRNFPSDVDSLGRVSPRHVQMSITVSTFTGFPLSSSTSLSVDVPLTAPPSLRLFSKPDGPGDRGVK